MKTTLLTALVCVLLSANRVAADSKPRPPGPKEPPGQTVGCLPTELLDTGIDSKGAVEQGFGGYMNGSLSNDGARLVFACQCDPLGTNSDLTNELFLYDVESSQVWQLTDSNVSSNGVPSLSGDGQTVAFRSSADFTGGNPGRGAQVFLVNLPPTDGSPYVQNFTQLTMANTPGRPGHPSISADGNIVVYRSTEDLPKRIGGLTRSRESYILFDRTTGTFTQLEGFDHGHGAGQQVHRPVISRDGTRFAVQARMDFGCNPDVGNEVFVYDIPTHSWQQVTHMTNGWQVTGQLLSLDAGADHVVYSLNDGGNGFRLMLSEVDFTSGCGGTRRAHLVDGDTDFHLSANGRRLAYFDGGELNFAELRYTPSYRLSPVESFQPRGVPQASGLYTVLSMDADGSRIAAQSRRPDTSGRANLVFLSCPGEADENGNAGDSSATDTFVRGDADGDGELGMNDALAILDRLYRGKNKIDCDDAADANDDGELDMSDALVVLNYLYLGKKPARRVNLGERQKDATIDSLGCGNRKRTPKQTPKQTPEPLPKQTPLPKLDRVLQPVVRLRR